jgi:hypothetical protein
VALAVDADSVYFTNSSTLWKVARDGGIPTALAGDQGAPNAVVVDGTGVYWTDGTDWPPPPDGGGGQVVKITPK